MGGGRGAGGVDRSTRGLDGVIRDLGCGEIDTWVAAIRGGLCRRGSRVIFFGVGGESVILQRVAIHGKIVPMRREQTSSVCE